MGTKEIRELNDKNEELYLALILELQDWVDGASHLGMLFPKESKATFTEPQLGPEEVD